MQSLKHSNCSWKVGYPAALHCMLDAFNTVINFTGVQEYE